MLCRLATGRTDLRRTPQFLMLLAMVLEFVPSFGHFDPQEAIGAGLHRKGYSLVA
jgi:hypothetical protein